ncbi:MAG: glycerol-3-phosphate 1-O-acyltransferase PlsY [Sutterellaceae bacterium]|nr:glycerol-3-phosphate 1-O-acyltransferase PlsY [Burkholderiaceae bacterium]MCX7900811.1 glycerol-3-phosphate 1-O-acyltransferase PlsY [Burkholderiaceae bacterium]MDW8430482.1 glycerol-3-phosphate 1-O-acyltransferase PlsY [Sutterellaceae bacterium]
MGAATLLFFVAVGYLLGSVSFAVLVSKVFGLADPRTYGSRNPGATNVLRSGHRVAAALTLAGDALKGALAVWLAQRFGPAWGVGAFGIAATGLAAFLGHLYPLFFRFQGGKGVATFFGVLGLLNPWLAVACGVTWGLVAYFFRYASLASVAAAVVAVFGQAFGWGFDGVLLCVIAMASLLLYRHRTNIANLRAGRERRIGEKAEPAAPRR